jgi:hypothetical protein
VWKVLHKGDTVLGQRVTRLQGGFFCDCPNFVLRAMHCKHICAVIELEAAFTRAGATTPRFESTLHRDLQPDAEVRKRSGPPRAVPQRHLAEGACVVVKTESGGTQVGTVVGNARETCDVAFGKDEPRNRVPVGSILQWVASGKLTRTATDTAPRKRAIKQIVRTPEFGEADPKAVRWQFKLRGMLLKNTCPYDAIFTPLMHLLASNLPLLVGVRNRLKQDHRMGRLHDVYRTFWASENVNEVRRCAAPRGARRVKA